MQPSPKRGRSERSADYSLRLTERLSVAPRYPLDTTSVASPATVAAAVIAQRFRIAPLRARLVVDLLGFGQAGAR